ncbi:DNA-binding response regulator [Cohnella sp. CIP 111063]|uniref:response regulator transcription factor n=1 Tax=unclassified Cohnella TaxID=2636738 RepID=UPI000B8BDFA3|nr:MULTISPECIES: response regulator transcription factor [unclassified Cohnella]OXS54944.1 DNA-binding response regulator [Cohnella sp. CIP 111063]PRX65086.1 DNA-binding response OmpR family regulator [Cohnella sp. SGD-V74]
MTVDFFSYPTNKKILIVDDEEPMRELLQLYLTAEGFATDSAIDGEEAIRRLEANSYDLVLLDLMMPKMDGLDVCKWIRQVSTVPIIMLTARDETIDKVVGLKIGADDYLTKPFDRAELMARIHSLFRRGNLKLRNETPEYPNRKAVLSYEALHLNMQNHQVFYRDRELLLTPKEYAILKLFLSNKGRIFQREDILELLWKNRSINDDRTVDTHIKNLRDKLTQAGIPGQQVIKTIWGTGFICHEDT